MSNEADKMRLIFSKRETLYRFNPSASGQSADALASGKFIYGVTYDYGDRKLFYTERDENAVFVADINEAADLSNVEYYIYRHVKHVPTMRLFIIELSDDCIFPDQEAD